MDAKANAKNFGLVTKVQAYWSELQFLS